MRGVKGLLAVAAQVPCELWQSEPQIPISNEVRSHFWAQEYTGGDLVRAELARRDHGPVATRMP